MKGLLACNWTLSRGGIVIRLTIALGMTATLWRASEAHAKTDETELRPVLITTAMRSQDPRLDKPVTLNVRQATSGDLLKEISRQTGIEIMAGGRDGSGDESVAAFCEGVPAARILNAVWAAMSHRGGLWEWQRGGEAGRYRYTLLQPAAARKLRQRLRAEVQEKLERDAARLLEVVEGTEEQKAQALKEVYGESDSQEVARRLGLKADRYWTDLRSFKEALSPEQRLAVLRGEATIKAPTSLLSPASQKFYLDTHRQVVAKRSPNLSGTTLSLPKEIWFEPRRYYALQAVSISVPDCTSMNPVLGGALHTRAFWARIQTLWMLDGDSAGDPAEERTMKRPPDVVPESQPVQPAPPAVQPVSRRPDLTPEDTIIGRLARRLEQVAECAGVPLVARLPQDQQRIGLADPDGMVLREYRQRLWNVDLMVKWRDGVLLVSMKDWPLEDLPVPGAFISQLRKHGRPAELLPFDDITAAADQLTYDQILRLQDEFPTMKGVAEARWFLALFRHPDLARQALSDKSLKLTPSVITLIRPLMPNQVKGLIDQAAMGYLSLTLSEDKIPGHPTRDVFATLRGYDGNLIGTFVFRDRAQWPKPAMKE
jgi:hypothetical protein